MAARFPIESCRGSVRSNPNPCGDVTMTFKNVAGRAIHRTLLALVIAAGCLGGPTMRAVAQGTSGQLPDPISSADIGELVDRLQLSSEQRSQVEAFHAQYKEQFKVVRDGEIEAFMKESRQMSGMGRMPTRDDAEKLFQDSRRILRRIESLDDSFFNQVASVLTEQQAPTLPRLRLARERDRYRSQITSFVGMMNPAANVDLSAMFNDLKLSPEQFEVTDPIVMSYEQRYTKATRDMQEQALTAMLEMITAMESAGFADMDMQESMKDPEQAKKMLETLQAAWDVVNVATMEKAAETAKLNRTTCRELLKHLPPEPARQLRTRFYRRAYPEAFLGEDIENAFRRALRMKDLTQAQIDTIAAIQAEYLNRAEQIAQEMMDIIDEQRKTRSMFDFGRSGDDESATKLDELRAQRAEAAESARETLHAMLGEQLVARLAQPEEDDSVTDAFGEDVSKIVQSDGGDQPQHVGGEAQIVVEGGGVGGATFVAVSGNAVAGDGSADPYIAGPISIKDIDSYARWLRLSDDQKEILKSLHADYLETFRSALESDMKAIADAQASTWTFEDGKARGAGPQTVDKLYGMRRAALQSVQRVDGSFFDDLGQLILEESQQPRLQRVRSARLRTVYNRQSWGMGFMPGTSREQRIDLVRLIDQLELDSTTLDSLDAPLSAYEQVLAVPFRDRFEASLASQQSMEKLSMEMMQAQQEAEGEEMDQGAMIAMGLKMQEAMRADRDRIKQAEKTIVDTNRSSLQQLVSALGSEAGGHLAEAYDRAAFPEAFSDSDSAGQYFTRALELHDLTDSQRDSIKAIESEFNAASKQLSQTIINELKTGSVGFDYDFDPEKFQELQARQAALEKLRFDRRELNAATISKLRSALSEAQVARLGGLRGAEKKEETGFNFAVPD